MPFGEVPKGTGNKSKDQILSAFFSFVSIIREFDTKDKAVKSFVTKVAKINRRRAQEEAIRVEKEALALRHEKLRQMESKLSDSDSDSDDHSHFSSRY